MKLVCSVSDIRDWAKMDTEDINTVVQSNFLKGFRRRQEQLEQVAMLPSSVKRLISAQKDSVKEIEDKSC